MRLIRNKLILGGRFHLIVKEINSITYFLDVFDDKGISINQTLFDNQLDATKAYNSVYATLLSNCLPA